LANDSGISRRQALTGVLSWPATAGAASHADASAAAQPGPEATTLVAYFSRTGNTRVIAHQIHRARRADFFEIRPVDPYPEDYQETVRQAERERQAGYRPPLASAAANVGAYDTIFLGFPIWGMTTPPVIRSFLSRHDLSGKALVPFVTHGGYGVGTSMSVLAEHAPGSRILEAFVLRQDQERETLAEVTRWLGGTGLIP
jgi:flavodoxin